MTTPATTPEEQRAASVQRVIMESSEISTFIRTKWHGHAATIHPEVTRGTLPTLLAIARHEPISATELVCRFGLEKTLVSRQVTQLRSLGLIDTRVSEQDRRVTLLFATAETKERLTHVRKLLADDYNERLSGWAVEDLEHLSEMMHRFNHPAQ